MIVNILFQNLSREIVEAYKVSYLTIIVFENYGVDNAISWHELLRKFLLGEFEMELKFVELVFVERIHSGDIFLLHEARSSLVV